MKQAVLRARVEDVVYERVLKLCKTLNISESEFLRDAIDHKFKSINRSKFKTI